MRNASKGRGLHRVALGAALALAVTLAAPTLAGARNNRLTAMLDGMQEAPGPGHPSATGNANITLKIRARQACYRLQFQGLAPDNPTSGHIHSGAVGMSGPIAIGLFAQTGGMGPYGLPQPPMGRPSPIEGCASNVKRSLLRAIRANPGGYYVNLHNGAYPAGAIRGQLARGGPGY